MLEECRDPLEWRKVMRREIWARRVVHEDLAANIGVHKSTITKWLNGQREPTYYSRVGILWLLRRNFDERRADT